MSDPALLVDVRAAVATVAFNRPGARNALTAGQLRDLEAVLRDLGPREDVRVVVLRGAGEQPFSSGYDMGELSAGPHSAADARAIHAPIRSAAQAIVDSPVPVIAAARGFVYGSALDLFAHCDLRLCTQDCRFCMPPNRHGFLYPDAGLERLVQVAGPAGAADLLLTAQPIDSERARSLGLVQRVAASDRFEADLLALCETVLRNAPLSLLETRRALARLARHGPAAGAAEEAMYDRIARCLDSADCREAQLAFREKREPRFGLPPAASFNKETGP